MGFGLPAALGAAAACPDAVVVDIDGDGSFMMNVQARANFPPLLCMFVCVCCGEVRARAAPR